MKKLMSVLCAAALVMSLAVSVSAADYGSPPNYTQPDNNNTTTTDDTKKDEVKPVVVVTEKVVTEALKAENPVIAISGNATLQKNAIAEIVKAGKVVTFEAEDYSVIIDPADITDGAKAINLKMDIKPSNNGINIFPSAKGAFGFALTVVIPAETIKASGYTIEDLKAFYIADDGEISRVDLIVKEDGSVALKINHASSYVITTENLIPEEDDVAASDDDLDTDEDDIFDDDDFDDDFVDDDDAVDFTDDTSDDSTKDVDSDIVNIDTPEETSSGTEKNPSTGVTVSFIAAGAAGLIALATKKSKK